MKICKPSVATFTGAIAAAAIFGDSRDACVRYLADRLIRDQVKEIAETNLLLEDIEQRGRRSDQPLAAVPAVLEPDGTAKVLDLLSGDLLAREPL